MNSGASLPYIDGYEIHSILGSGGFGTVYAANNVMLGRKVALKVLHGKFGATERMQFRDECRMQGSLSGHPNIVTLYKAQFDTSQVPFIELEYMEDGSIGDLIRKSGRIPWRRAVDLLLPVCEALTAAHEAGVLHKDVKPDNMLMDSGTAKLSDFGLASLTDLSTVVPAFSVYHTAPETGHSSRDERSDLYSVASSLYEMISGRPAFWSDADESPQAVLARLATAPVTPLGREVCPPNLNDTILRAMAKDPSRRPESVRAFSESLLAIQGASADGGSAARGSTVNGQAGYGGARPWPRGNGSQATPTYIPRSSDGMINLDALSKPKPNLVTRSVAAGLVFVCSGVAAGLYFLPGVTGGSDEETVGVTTTTESEGVTTTESEGVSTTTESTDTTERATTSGTQTTGVVIDRADHNGDGEVDCADVQLVLDNLTSKTGVFTPKFDLNQDDTVNGVDVREMVLRATVPVDACETTTTTPTTEVVIDRADHNGDGEVDCADVQLVSDNLSINNNGAVPPQYDINGDGTVNVRDATETIARATVPVDECA